jgi:DNA helicase-2/ATP-dependent DNA helicase PcrA
LTVHSSPTERDGASFGRQCELAFGSWLEQQGYFLEPTCNAVANTQRSQAPLVQVKGRSLRAPDFQTKKGGQSQYWEVKYRSRPFTELTTGKRGFLVEVAAFRDYQEIERLTGCPVWIVVYWHGVDGRDGWRRVRVSEAAACGHALDAPNHEGRLARQWFWPIDRMEVLPTPPLSQPERVPSPLSADESTPPIPMSEFDAAEREAREAAARVSEPAPACVAGGAAVGSRARAIDADHEAGLEVLCRRLGMPKRPCYSVVLVGGDGVDLREALALLEYGIRLFLVTRSRPKELFDATAAHRQARLLEWSELSALRVEGGSAWIVDGDPEMLARLVQPLEEADAQGGINLRQYRIVHAAPTVDVLVTAGAGTGKTETMSERLVYLLATSHAAPATDDAPARPRLGLDEVALVTFTREAAREMRERLARTLVLRQRLCPLCVHPTVRWLTQLSRTQISTIHTFAKELLRRFGSEIGLSPGFRVSPQTLVLRDRITRALSHELATWYRDAPKGTKPIHKWRDLVETVWEALENNGVPLIRFGGGTPALGAAIDWGQGIGRTGSIEAAAAGIVERVIASVAAEVEDECVREQVLRTSQLVPAAVGAMATVHGCVDRQNAFRYLFIDEFQDTDAMQIELLVAVRDRLGARMFTVGDVKQGIYRFRGASGDAFSALKDRVRRGGAFELREFDLRRNFRTDGRLLESMETHFKRWKGEGLLPGLPKDGLLPDTDRARAGRSLRVQRSGRRTWKADLVAAVADLRRHDREASVAVLCRRNSHAKDAQRVLIEGGIDCGLVVGGDFFRNPAVREARVLLEALLDPDDDAALLELCETRWSGRLFAAGDAPVRGVAEEPWRGGEVAAPRAWRDRLVDLVERDRTIAMADLAVVRARLHSLSDLQRRMSAVALFVACIEGLSPQCCTLGDAGEEASRAQYALDLSHLVTLMDAQFAESAATLSGVLEWLRIQIATNRNEDAPRAAEEGQKGSVTALTAHKAKGLEYDFVVIPYTFTDFGTPSSIESEAFVLSDGRRAGGQRLVWNWYESVKDKETNEWSRKAVFRNCHENDAVFHQNEIEVRREEARLLYVAMTRARKRLVVFSDGRGIGEDGGPASWSGLLGPGEVSR